MPEQKRAFMRERKYILGKKIFKNVFDYQPKGIR